MDFALAIIKPVVELVLVSVIKQLGFVVSSSNHVEQMRAKVNELNRAANVVDSTLKENKEKCLVVPEHNVKEWLKEVEKIKQREESVPNDGVRCFHMKKRYKVGKQSLDIIKDIDSLMKEKDGIRWSDEIKPLAIVSPPRTTTSATFHDTNRKQKIFESRVSTFNVALNSLNPNTNKIQKLALCGMGGVGKTIIMEQLKEAANKENMFNWIVKVDVGQKPDPIILQRAVAEYITGKDLPVETKGVRAELLQKRFKEMSEEGRKKILIMLDEVWEWFDLKEIGLASPLPDGIKLLLSSRDENVCTQMGVESSSIFKVDVLEGEEAKKLFWEITRLDSDGDNELDLRHIGEAIVKRCGGLPLAITTIAAALRENKEKDEWRDTLSRLEKSDDFKIKAIFEASYENLKDDDLRSIFLLCGLFPEDCNIVKEEILRIGWGLKLFPDVHTLEKARRRVNTCVNKLIRSNLLLKSGYDGCVKMHDLVRDFVLSNYSNVKQASIVDHNGNVSDELKEKVSYERILVKCGGMSRFPIDFNHPHLTLLMIMGGDNQLQFPEDFYKRMEKLEVVAYENIHRPLLPQYLTNLRALSLRACSFVGDDISFLGDLINLEVLNLAYCGIHMLPSKIGNLKRLKLLDLNGCEALCIDDGVFQNLDKLEELYMKVSGREGIRFTPANLEELKNLSRRLSTLEFEFFNNKAQPKYVSFERLERFRISIGCSLSFESYLEFKNTLQLVAKSSELVECKINELFYKTDVLHLKIYDLNNLEDISTHSPHFTFRNLKSLCVFGSVHLTCLFTILVGKELRKLESLVIEYGPVLKEIWPCKISSSEEEAYNSPMLREILVKNCEALSSVIPYYAAEQMDNLHVMKIKDCINLKEVFETIEITIDPRNITTYPAIKIPIPRNITIHKFPNIKELEIRGCDQLENIFTFSTLESLKKLESLMVTKCKAMEVIVREENGGQTTTSSKVMMEFPHLKSIILVNLPHLSGFFLGMNVNFRWPLLDYVMINDCPQMVVFTSGWSTTPKLEYIHANIGKHDLECGLNIHQTPTSYQKSRSTLDGVSSHPTISEEGPLSFHSLIECNLNGHYGYFIFPFDKLYQLQKLEIIHVDFSYATGVFEDEESLTRRRLNRKHSEEVFEEEIFEQVAKVTNNESKTVVTFPKLREVRLKRMVHLKYIWKSKYHRRILEFPNMTRLSLIACDSLEHLFTYSIVTSMMQLKELHIESCNNMKVIVKEEEEEGDDAKPSKIVKEEEEEDDDAKARKIVFPCLKSLKFEDLWRLEGFCLGKKDFTFPYLDTLVINRCPEIKVFTEGLTVAPKLTVIDINNKRVSNLDIAILMNSMEQQY